MELSKEILISEIALKVKKKKRVLNNYSFEGMTSQKTRKKKKLVKMNLIFIIRNKISIGIINYCFLL